MPSSGSDAIAIEADVGGRRRGDRAFAQAEAIAPVDAVFNAAGMSSSSRPSRTTDEQWQRQLQARTDRDIPRVARRPRG